MPGLPLLAQIGEQTQRKRPSAFLRGASSLTPKRVTVVYPTRESDFIIEIMFAVVPQHQPTRIPGWLYPWSDTFSSTVSGSPIARLTPAA